MNEPKNTKQKTPHGVAVQRLVRPCVELANQTQTAEAMICREHLKNTRKELAAAWSSESLSWEQAQRLINADVIIGDVWWKLYEGSTA